MILTDGYVYCENVGGVHEDVPDPEMVGPLHGDNPMVAGWGDPAWSYHSEPHNGFPGHLWHYTCPGPHRRLWAGREVT